MDDNNRNKIIEELNNHIRGYSYANVLAYLGELEVLLFNDDDFIHPKEHLSYDEWLFIIGLWLKNINKDPSHIISTFDDVECEAQTIKKLLEKLHYSYLFDVSSLYSSSQIPLDSVLKNALNSSALIQEAIFYGGNGAYNLQYVSFIAEKYKNDRDWILQNKGVDINKFQPFFLTLERMLNQKMKEFISTKCNSRYGIIYPYMIEIKELVKTDPEYQKIIDLLSFDVDNPKEITISGIEDFNTLVECPLIKIDNNHLFIPNSAIIASALYELPFFWIVKDYEYYEKYGKHHRGDAAENITKELLNRIFPPQDVIKNVKVVQRKKVRAEIDILVKHKETAIVFQVKSKRLSQDSRKGNKTAIANDFEKALGKAFSQAIESEKWMKNSESTLICNEGEISIANTKKAIKIGITLDYFPAVEALTRRGFGEKAPFISMSIFDLDMLTRYLNADQFIDYITYRVDHREEMFNSNESGYFGFYLKYGGFGVIDSSLKKQGGEYNYVAIGEDFSYEVDKRMLPDLMKEYLPWVYQTVDS